MKKQSFSRRLSCIGSAVALTIATIFPSLMGATAHAFPSGAQVTSRSIKMSSSKQSDTGVSYDIKFNLGTAHTVKGVIVDFCAGTGGSPIVGDTNCAAPTGFTVGTPTVANNQGLTGTWTASALNSGRTLKYVSTTGNALSAGATVEFTLSTVTNTSTLGTFYARIVTYNADATGDITTYTPANPGTSQAIDYGGIALSTANQLTITAKVQESLTFCVYITGTTCAASPTGTAVALGDANGVLASYTTNYTNTAKFNVASNAQGGVVVNMKGENLCRVASPCTNTDTGNIITRSADACTTDLTTSSVEQFGVRLSVAGSGVTSTNYNCGANSHAFNRTNTVSTYGDEVAKTTAPGDEVVSTLEFMAKAATTSEAGIYTTVIGLIATGTY